MELKTITDSQGREVKTYTPDIETARKAPAFICAVASRIKRVKEILKKLRDQRAHIPANQIWISHTEIEKIFKECLEPLPFENELLSGDIQKVDQAINNITIDVDYNI